VANSIVNPEYESTENEKHYRNVKNKTRRLSKKIAGQKRRLEKLSNHKSVKGRKISRYLKRLQSKLGICEKKFIECSHKVKRKLSSIFRNGKLLKPSPNYVCMETLDIKGMCKNKKLSKAILRESLHMLSCLIEYKCKRLGISFVRVPQNFASSKLCSNCGNRVDSLKDYHVFHCPQCNSTLDRDFNAALNLKKKGLELLRKCNCYSVTPLDLSNLPFSCDLDKDKYCSICNCKEACVSAFTIEAPLSCSYFNTCDFSSCNCGVGGKDYSSHCKKKYNSLLSRLPFSCSNFGNCDFNNCGSGRDYSPTCKENFREWQDNLHSSCSNFSNYGLNDLCNYCNYSYLCNKKFAAS